MTTVTAPDLSALPAALARDLDAAFPEVVRALAKDLWAGMYRMLGDRQEAEDVVQDAFLRAYRALEEYPPRRVRELQLKGWVWTIAANLARNHLRSRSRRPEVPIVDREFAVAGPGPEDDALTLAGNEHLAGLLLDLPFPMRAAVVLHHVVGMPYAEIAEVLDRPSGTVRSDAHRGLDRLRTMLTKEAS
jgi:RNA polymerase sigma-70 factor (ECF subfamily)